MLYSPRKPEQRLAQHNSDYTQLTGRIVKETGQKWKLKEFIAVPDAVSAESAFGYTTGLPPWGCKEEVMHMEWERLVRVSGFRNFAQAHLGRYPQRIGVDQSSARSTGHFGSVAASQQSSTWAAAYGQMRTQ
jgi:hypothetical protein